MEIPETLPLIENQTDRNRLYAFLVMQTLVHDTNVTHRTLLIAGDTSYIEGPLFADRQIAR